MEDVPIPRAELIALMELVTSLLNEKSERSLAIVSSAKIEVLLREAVRASTGQTDLGYGKSVRLLENLGLVDAQTAKCLNWFWDIRCKFAHDPNHCSFADGEIAKIFKKFQSALEPHVASGVDGVEKKILGDISKQIGREAPKDWLPGTKEMRFMAMAAMALSLHLLVARSLAPKQSVPPEFGVFRFKSV